MQEQTIIARAVPAGAGQSVGFKIAVVGFLILLSLVPSAMIRSLILERQSRRAEAV